MDCICLHIKKSFAHALGGVVVRHFSLQLMNSLNKKETAIFFMQAVFPKGLSFSQLNYGCRKNIV